MLTSFFPQVYPNARLDLRMLLIWEWLKEKLTDFHWFPIVQGLVFLRIYWRLSTILKTSNKSVWSNVFWHVKVYIFWKFIQYTIIEIKHTNAEKISYGQNKRYNKNALFFLLWAPAHHSFTFNSQFLY